MDKILKQPSLQLNLYFSASTISGDSPIAVDTELKISINEHNQMLDQVQHIPIMDDDSDIDDFGDSNTGAPCAADHTP